MLLVLVEPHVLLEGTVETCATRVSSGGTCY